MVHLLKKTLLTIFMAGIACWVARYGYLSHKVEKYQYAFTGTDARKFNHFFQAQYDFGQYRWLTGDRTQAKKFFQTAVNKNPLFIDAWLKIAQVEMAQGNLEKAVHILKFTNQITDDIVKWKWPLILLAHELGVKKILLQNINFIIPYPQIRDDAFQIFEKNYGSHTAGVIEFLDPKNLPYYLQWLIKWQRASDSLLVWDAMPEIFKKDEKLANQYVNFLISQKEIPRAAKIWQKLTGLEGIANPDFELPLSSINGFDWRLRQGPNKEWRIQRLPYQSVNGSYALRISFSGEENIFFYHFNQIVPVQPLCNYALSFWWRSKDLTTDQRPFIQIKNFDCGTHLANSQMIDPSLEWQKETLFFLIPEDCHAIDVRVMRNRSSRFDSKIKGAVWLDSFQLEKNPPFFEPGLFDKN